VPQGRHPLRCRELLVRLEHLGIWSRSGKGSHIILFRPGPSGRTYPVSCHGPTTEVSVHIINAILRRFEIPTDTFWNG
jgi:predicted RNA binding protein YcfA (HicA-like mRNA interferase family)